MYAASFIFLLVKNVESKVSFSLLISVTLYFILHHLIILVYSKLNHVCKCFTMNTDCDGYYKKKLFVVTAITLRNALSNAHQEDKYYRSHGIKNRAQINI